MNMRFFAIAAILPMVLFGASAQASTRATSVLRQYPIANALEESVSTNIGITALQPFAAATIADTGIVSIWGSRSGEHAVTLHLSDDGETLIVHPAVAFSYDETIRVLLHAALADGTPIFDSFQFQTMRRPLDVQPVLERMNRFMLPASSLQADDTEALADTLPPMIVTTDQGATPGTIFFTNFTVQGPKNNTFLFNLDEHGNILKQQNLRHTVGLDFKAQPNGMLTYFNSTTWKYYGLDSNWNVLDSFTSANGYPLDVHELRVFPDGGYAVLAVSGTSLDSSQWVPGMTYGTTIGGDVIQIFDAHHNLTFQWRGIDHYRVADAIHENLADTGLIDFEHANSLDFDSFGNVLISNRHLCEITQIDRKTGAMLWRLGGAHDQFKLVNDSIWFSYQHAARWLPNGHLVLFDNSNFDSVYAEPHDSGVFIYHSRALEYALDTDAMTATLVWQFHHSPETFTVAMGNVDRLPNGNTFIGWGLNTQVAMTEVRPDNSTAFEMRMDSGNVSYRAFKYPSNLSFVTTEPVTIPLDLGVNMTGQRPVAIFTMPSTENATLDILDQLGRRCNRAFGQFEAAGPHALDLGAALGPGAYFCQLRLEDGRTAVAPFVITH